MLEKSSTNHQQWSGLSLSQQNLENGVARKEEGARLQSGKQRV